MEQNFLQSRRIKQIILIISFILLILAIYLTNSSLSFHVVNINPGIATINTLTPYIDINFNDKLKNTINIYATGDIIKGYKISNKQLIVYFKIPLNSKTKYTINLNSITDQHNNKINLTYSFTPIFKVNNLSQKQSQYLLNQQVQYDKNELTNQLMALLPFTSPNGAYEINYKNINGFVLVITAQGSINQQAALEWLTAEGFNTNNYHIQYINQAP